MNARLQTIIDEAKARVETKNTNGREKVNVCIDTSSIARGGEETLAKIREVAESKGLRIDIGVTGSWGFSWMEPTVTVRSAAGTQTILYANVTADRVEEFIEATVVSGGTMPELALGVVEGTATDDIALLSDHPWMKGQERRLMEYIYEEGFCDEATRDIDWIGSGDLLMKGEIPQDEFERVKLVVESFTKTKPKAELLQAALERSLLMAPVATFEDVTASEQLASRDYWRMLEHPDLPEPVRYPGPFAKFSATPIEYRRRAPAIGEHNREVYIDELGLSEAELAALQERGVV